MSYKGLKISYAQFREIANNLTFDLEQLKVYKTAYCISLNNKPP